MKTGQRINKKGGRDKGNTKAGGLLLADFSQLKNNADKTGGKNEG